MNKDKKPISETHPDLAKEADGWDPSSISAGSDKNLQWKCKLGHVWLAAVYSRKDGNSCPYCGNKKVLTGFNDLATTHPELAKEADGWDPRKVIAGTPKKLQWKCSKGHIWIVNGNNRVIYKTQCPYCSNSKVLSGFNDLSTTHPELARESHGWDPTKVMAGSHKKLKWECSAKHVWTSEVRGRVFGNGCPICSNKKLLSGFNDLATTHPKLAEEAHGWDPTKIIAGTTKKLKWQCRQGHSWDSFGYSRLNGHNCPYCANQKVLAGYNDLATTHPKLAEEAHGWDPSKVVAGSGNKYKWKCSNGHKWNISVNARVQGSGCPSCSKTGFDPNQNGYIYFLIQPKWEIYQIGITNVPQDRLNRHSKNGFELLELRGPLDGQTAQELETALLRYLKSQKADLSPEHVAGKFDGYSESWTIDSFQINSLKELIDRTREAGY